MDHVKEIREHEESGGEMSWKKCAIKQGYLINFHRGLLKAPKMQYFVLTANGLVSFEGRPHHESKPLCFLPYQRLSSIKLDNMELNSCRLCCMQLTSKTSPSFTLAFSCKEDRDEWMMIMMKAFSEALLTTRVFNKTASTSNDEDKANEDCVRKEKLGRKVSSTAAKEERERRSSYGQSLRRKRRKGEKGSIRKSKSYDSLALHDVTNTASNFHLTTKDKRLSANPLRSVTGNIPLSETRKRKSEPDVHVISHFPNAWTTDNMEKLFANSCSFEHRDSLTVQAEKQLRSRSKSEVKHKSNVFAKLRSKLENPVKYAH
jgi:hypothetical protein